MAREGLTIHQIIAITAFPFHWDPSGVTHTHEDSLLYLEAGVAPPSFILQPQFKTPNEHRPRYLYSRGGCLPFNHRRSCEIPCIYRGPSLESVSGHTTPPRFALPAVAHKLSKPGFHLFTLRRAQREACRGSGKELCLFKHVFKKRGGGVRGGGDLLNGGQSGSAAHRRHMEE